ncbi:MAG: hypothetical protein IJN34_03765 [Clostridia bacterium]|nr:hypothetical protein [Clostridia bacterium]
MPKNNSTAVKAEIRQPITVFLSEYFITIAGINIKKIAIVILRHADAGAKLQRKRTIKNVPSTHIKYRFATSYTSPLYYTTIKYKSQKRNDPQNKSHGSFLLFVFGLLGSSVGKIAGNLFQFISGIKSNTGLQNILSEPFRQCVKESLCLTIHVYHLVNRLAQFS